MNPVQGAAEQAQSQGWHPQRREASLVTQPETGAGNQPHHSTSEHRLGEKRKTQGTTLKTCSSARWRADSSLLNPGMRFTVQSLVQPPPGTPQPTTPALRDPPGPGGTKGSSGVPLGGRSGPGQSQPPPPAPATHLGVGFGLLQGAGVTQLVPEEAEGADAAAVLAAEELEDLVVLRALALLQVAQGRAELVVAEGRAVLVGPQVLGAEGGGAGQAGLHGRGLPAAVAVHGGRLRPRPRRLLILLLLLDPGPGAALELLHHPAQHRVLLQLRAAREGGPALRAAEVPRQPGPGELQAGGAEVVPARHRHGAAEEAEADGAGQLLLQPRQARLRRRPGQRRHRPGFRCPVTPETKLGPDVSRNPRAPSPPRREGRQHRDRPLGPPARGDAGRLPRRTTDDPVNVVIKVLSGNCRVSMLALVLRDFKKRSGIV